jgi:hypothetical protein
MYNLNDPLLNQLIERATRFGRSAQHRIGDFLKPALNPTFMKSPAPDSADPQSRMPLHTSVAQPRTDEAAGTGDPGINKATGNFPTDPKMQVNGPLDAHGLKKDDMAHSIEGVKIKRKPGYVEPA